MTKLKLTDAETIDIKLETMRGEADGKYDFRYGSNKTQVPELQEPVYVEAYVKGYKRGKLIRLLKNEQSQEK